MAGSVIISGLIFKIKDKSRKIKFAVLKDLNTSQVSLIDDILRFARLL